MNTRKLQRIIKATGIAFSLIFAIGIFSTNTQAQRRGNQRNNDDYNRRDNRNNDNYNRHDNRNDNNRYGNNSQNQNNDYNNIYRGSVQHGYQDGLIQGAADARNGRRGNAQQSASRRIRQATGNNPGPTAPYYREGFIRGYNEAYNRYGNDRRYNNNNDRRYDNNNDEDYYDNR